MQGRGVVWLLKVIGLWMGVYLLLGVTVLSAFIVGLGVRIRVSFVVGAVIR